MNKGKKIQGILAEDFPGAKIRHTTLTIRDNGEMSMRCMINGQRFYLGSLPDSSRKKIWKLLNQ